MHARVHVHSCKQSPHRTSASSVSRSTYNLAVLAPCISLSFDDPWFRSSRRMELTAFVSQHLAELFSTRDQPPKRPAPQPHQIAPPPLSLNGGEPTFQSSRAWYQHRATSKLQTSGVLQSAQVWHCFEQPVGINFSSLFYFPLPQASSKLMLLLQPVYILTQTPGVQTRRHQKYRLLQSDSNTPRHRRPLWAHRVAATNHFEQLATPGAAFSIGCWDFFPQYLVVCSQQNDGKKRSQLTGELLSITGKF